MKVAVGWNRNCQLALIPDPRSLIPNRELFQNDGAGELSGERIGRDKQVCWLRIAAACLPRSSASP